MKRTNSRRYTHSSIALATLLACLSAPSAHAARETPVWSGAEETEELEGNFEERVHELQGWLQQREAERRGSWGNEVVTPENRAPNSGPRYFLDRGYDEQGYRRLNDNTRFRLRSQDSAWEQGIDNTGGSPATADDPSSKEEDTSQAAAPRHATKLRKKGKVHHGKRRSRGKRR